MIPPLDLLIAVALIVCPAEIPTEPPCALDSLRAAALSLELLDPRETGYYFVRRSEFASDLRSICERYADLKDAPPLDDYKRFPTVEQCQQQKDFSRAYVAFLEERSRLFPDEQWIYEAIGECGELYRLWDWADDCQRGYFVYWRRRCLLHMRETIGPHLYYAGCLPPSVPMWAFRVID